MYVYSYRDLHTLVFWEVGGGEHSVSCLLLFQADLKQTALAAHILLRHTCKWRGCNSRPLWSVRAVLQREEERTRFNKENKKVNILILLSGCQAQYKVIPEILFVGSLCSCGRLGPYSTKSTPALLWASLPSRKVTTTMMYYDEEMMGSDS